MSLSSYPPVSLIISTYNWPRALEVCLLRIREQTIIPNEIIIADDGSGPDTAHMIEKMREDYPCPIIHVWHEDVGFTVSVIRNKAIVRSSFDFIVQIDGDIIPDKHLIEDHLKFSKDGFFATGSRVMLSPERTADVLQSENGLKDLSSFTSLKSLRLPILANYFRFRYKKNSPHYIKGCNMSFWRKDLIAINGYDEDMTGWGYEDNEISARLLAAGIQKQYLKYTGVVYHLDHKINSHERVSINSEIYRKSIANKSVWCKNGLDKYLNV